MSLDQEELLVLDLVKVVNRLNLNSNRQVLVEIHSIRPGSKRLFPEGEVAEIVVELLLKHPVHAQLAMHDLACLVGVLLGREVESNEADFDLVVCIRVGHKLKKLQIFKL